MELFAIDKQDAWLCICSVFPFIDIDKQDKAVAIINAYELHSSHSHKLIQENICHAWQWGMDKH